MAMAMARNRLQANGQLAVPRTSFRRLIEREGETFAAWQPLCSLGPGPGPLLVLLLLLLLIHTLGGTFLNSNRFTLWGPRAVLENIPPGRTKGRPNERKKSRLESIYRKFKPLLSGLEVSAGGDIYALAKFRPGHHKRQRTLCHNSPENLEGGILMVPGLTHCKFKCISHAQPSSGSKTWPTLLPQSEDNQSKRIRVYMPTLTPSA